MASSTCDEFARSRKNGHSDRRHSAQQRWARELSPLMGELIADHQYDPSRGYFTQGNDRDWQSTADGAPMMLDILNGVGLGPAIEKPRKMASSTCDEFARSRKNGHSDRRHSAQQRWARELSPLMGELIADHQYDPSRGYFTQGNDRDWRSTADGDDVLVNSDLEETGSSTEISGHSEDEKPSGGGSHSMLRMGGQSSLPTSSHKERGQPMCPMGCQTVGASHGRDGKASGFPLGKEATTLVARGISQRDAHPSVRKKGSSTRRLSQSPPKALNQIVSQDEDEEDDVPAL
ncbi:hypothetical protein R1sor_022316 [Riccia sorocarpa]|uniref:Uncharacterized protein n=1 Tax=Riccia sorocarpa TaxID=122646 RepID=A0ABD3GMU2_9MARC